jgi:HK97 family phage major capsid protein
MPEVAQLARMNRDNIKHMSVEDILSEETKRSERMAWLFEKGGATFDLSADEAQEVRDLNDELTDLAKGRESREQWQELQRRNAERVKSLTVPAGSITHPSPSASVGEQREAVERAQKSLGQQFVDADEYKAMQGRGNVRMQASFPNVDMKTTMTLAAGFAQETRRNGRLVDYAVRRPVVADLIPQDNTTENAIVYMEETTFTNNADTVSENALKPESALAFTQRSQPVEVIATTLPITRQQWDDVPQIQAIVDNRLRLMLELTEEDQLLNGSGTTPDLIGFYNKSGIQTQAKGSDPTPDAIYKAFTKVRYTAFAEPSGVIMHPDDWQDVRLLRTVDGVYIFGSPADDGPERIWGKPVIVTTAATSGTGLTGDFQLFSHISRRMGVTVEAATEHGNDFVYNRITLRAEERLSLEIYRAAAFCTITGI